eukprot:TRINITY_DN2178_c0_g1_i1.p1 TRINITY_DN2178_c0_g1~~TRINITY_DN2178_c0_g1_i1.p1  ORF type:complete len:828 (+),score=166.55 TRINITY_DN2178_c0_g1_i1:27-2486(+)
MGDASSEDILSNTERKAIDAHLLSKSTFAEGVNHISRPDVWCDKDKVKKPRRMILVVGNNRLYAFKPQTGKIDFDFSLWDIVRLSSDKPNEFSIQLRNDTTYTFTFDYKEDTSEIIAAVHFLFAAAFPGLPLAQRLIVNITPKEREKEIFEDDFINPADADENDGNDGYGNLGPPDVGMCGGFPMTYMAFCDHAQIPPLADLPWHVDNVLGANDSNRKFDSSNCGGDRLAPSIKPTLMSLAINTYFTELKLTQLKLSYEGLISIAQAVSQNRTLRGLTLSHLHIVKDSFDRLVDALALPSSRLPLTYLDLSGTPIEDKGMCALAGYIKSSPHLLSTLLLSDCNASKVGFMALGDALASSDRMVRTLTRLDLSLNKIEADASNALSAYFARTSALTTLSLAMTAASFAQLKRCPTLTNLDISANKPAKSNMAGDFVKFVAGSPQLSTLVLSNTPHVSDVLEDLLGWKNGSSNTPSLTSLDVSESDIADDAMERLFVLIGGHPKLRNLNVSGNFVKGKAKTRVPAIEALMKMLDEKGKTSDPIVSLIMSGSQKAHLKTDLAPVLFSLMNNSSLTHLDIKGHQAGDLCAIALGKLLQTNNTLTSLHWDENATSLAGFIQFKIGLSRNKSLKVIPFPLTDMFGAQSAESAATSKDLLITLANEIQAMIDTNNAAGHHLPRSTSSSSLALGVSRSGSLTSISSFSQSTSSSSISSLAEGNGGGGGGGLVPTSTSTPPSKSPSSSFISSTTVPLPRISSSSSSSSSSVLSPTKSMEGLHLVEIGAPGLPLPRRSPSEVNIHATIDTRAALSLFADLKGYTAGATE